MENLINFDDSDLLSLLKEGNMEEIGRAHV